MGRGAPGARQGLGAPLPLPPALWGGCWARQAHGSFPKATQARQACGDSSEPGSRRRNGFPTVSSPAAALPTLPRTQAAPQSPGDGDRCPPQPPGGAGPQTSSPRGGRGFPCPIPHLQALWGRQQWDLWGYSGPQIRARSSPARFPSCPFHRERGTTAGGEGTAPVPRPPALLFPPQTPKDKIVGLSSKASSEAGCKEGFSSWDRRSPAHPLLKNPKIFQLAGLKTQKTQPQRHGHREQHGTDPKAATTRCPESTPRAPFGAGPLGIPFGAVPKSREEAEGTLAGQNQLLAGGSATAPGAARTHPAPQSRGETAGSEEGGKKPRKERPPRAVSPLLSSLCRVQLV